MSSFVPVALHYLPFPPLLSSVSSLRLVGPTRLVRSRAEGNIRSVSLPSGLPGEVQCLARNRLSLPDSEGRLTVRSDWRLGNVPLDSSWKGVMSRLDSRGVKERILL